ncbi:unnamed protein product [Closterium sp. NIES-54]
MASPPVLTFDAEGRAVDFDVWVDDLQLFLQCDSRDGVSLFYHTSGVSTAPTATADSTVCSQWTTRDAVARLAVRSHLPPAERAHFGQYKTAQSLYDAVVARYSSPATAALSRLILPYLFPDLAAFATVADLVAHLCTSDARYRAALPTEDHFLSLCPTEQTIDLLEERLAAAEKSILAVGASRGDRRTPFFEGRSPLPLLPSVASAAVVDLVGTEEVGAASAPSGRRRNSRGKGSNGGEGAAGGVMEEVVEAEGVALEVWVVPGVGASVAAVEVVEAAAEVEEAEQRWWRWRRWWCWSRCSQRQQQPRSRETLVVASASSSRAPVRLRPSSCFVSGTLGVGGLGRCFGCLTDASLAQFPDAVELPRWHDLLLHNVPIFDLDFDAILAAMYAIADSAEGDCYLRIPPDPGIAATAIGASAAAALGASASAAPGTGAPAAPGAGASPLSGTAPTESLHTFTLDSAASRSFFRDSTTLTPLSRPVAVSLADPSGGPVLAHSSTVLPCPAAPSGLLSGLHLPSFSTNLVSGADLQDAWVDQFTPGGQRVTHCTCSRTGRHLAKVHPSARSLPSLPPGPAPTCVPCVEGRQRAAPHSSSFPPTEAPLQTLHMNVWGPARVRGQGFERYFLLVIDEYSRYTTVFPLRSKGEVTEVLIDWIRGARRQLSESFGSDLPVLRLHSDKGGEFSSDLLRAFCRSEGIRQTLTLPASPQQNGIAERRIGMVMDVARSSMIHAAASHFLWPFAVRYAVHEINLQPRVSLPETTPTLRWTGKVGDASTFRVWGSRAFVRDTTADKLSSRAVPCVFLGFPRDAPGWQFYHPTSRRVLSSQDVTFEESVSYYHPAEPVEVAVDSCVEPASAGTGGAESGGAESGHAEPGGAEPGRVEPEGTVSGGAEPAGAASGGALGVSPRREPLSPQQLRE